MARAVTRSKTRAGFLGFSTLPVDAWSAISDALGPTAGIAAERTNHAFLDNLRDGRTQLKLPAIYACRFNMDNGGRYSKERYAEVIIEIVERYPNLKVLDATALYGGPLSIISADTHALTELMFRMYFLGLAPVLERLVVAAHTATIPRYLLECVHGVRVEPALSHDVMAFLAAGNAYGFSGESTQVTFKVENEDLTNKAHYYAVRASTPGGSEFEILWKDRGAGMDEVMLEESFGDEHPDSPAWGPDGDELDWDHPDFLNYCAEQEAVVMQGYANELAEQPFVLLLNADSGCGHDCCKIELVKKGDDYRVCSCAHQRPVFIAKDKEDESMCACRWEGDIS